MYVCVCMCIFLYITVPCSGIALTALLIFGFLCHYINTYYVYQDQSNLDSKSSSNCAIDKFDSTSAQKSRYPRIIILGFAKSGTSALRSSLLMHPNIKGCRCEPRFFDLNYARGLCWYINKVETPKPSQVVLEDSPGYVLTPKIVFPRLIKSLEQFNLKLNDLKFIIIVRHPIIRAISEYLQHGPTKPFDKLAIDSTGQANVGYRPIKRSGYSYYIKQCLEFVPSNQICFVNGDMLRTNPVLLMNKLEKCLGLPSNISSDNFVYNKERKLYCFVEDNKVRCPSIAKKGIPHPKITRRTADILMKFYEPYNKELYEITGEDYGWDYSYTDIGIVD